MLAAAPPFAADFVAFGFLVSRFDFCSPFAMTIPCKTTRASADARRIARASVGQAHYFGLNSCGRMALRPMQRRNSGACLGEVHSYLTIMPSQWPNSKDRIGPHEAWLHAPRKSQPIVDCSRGRIASHYRRIRQLHRPSIRQFAWNAYIGRWVLIGGHLWAAGRKVTRNITRHPAGQVAGQSWGRRHHRFWHLCLHDTLLAQRGLRRTTGLPRLGSPPEMQNAGILCERPASSEPVRLPKRKGRRC